MARVDPNVYALNIQLAFDATAAFTTLDEFGQKVTDLESDVSSAAQKAIQSLSSIAAEAQQHLGDISKQLSSIDTSSIKIQTSFTQTGKELKDQFDTGEERLDDLEEELKNWEKTYDLQGELGKELQKHLELNNEFLDLTQKIIKAVSLKNRGHADQNALLETDRDLAQGFNGDLDATTKKTKNLTSRTISLGMSWRSVWQWIKKADEDTEKFTTTNYRHYGSQQQLLQGARDLAMTNGIMYDKAVEAYAVMADLKVPREELDKYAKAVAQANRTTGVGVQATGEYANRLRTAGMSMQATERQLAFVGEAMRKYGLNTRDANALMNQSASDAKNAGRIFGDSADGLEKWEQSRAIMAGFAREAGHSADELASFESYVLNDAVALDSLKSQTNTTEKGIDGYRLAMLRAGVQTENTMAVLEARMAAGEDVSSEFKVTQENLINTMYGGNRAAYEASRRYGQLAKQHDATGKSIEDVNRLTEIYSNTISNQQAEANNTLTAQLKILWSTLGALSGTVGQFVADALLPFVKALNWLLSGLIQVIKGVSDFVKWMEQIPVIGKVITFLKWGAGIVLGLGIAFIFLGVAIVAIAGLFGSFGGITTKLVAGVQVLADMFLIVARAIGQAIVIILTSVGQGLQALGNSVKGVVGPLLAVGLALMMAGIGAYFFALGVKTIVEIGWAAVPAMIGLIVAIGLLGLVLVGLAMLVQGPVAVGLVILAAAILAVGLAALMMGTGIYMAGMGLQLMAGVISTELVLQIGALGLAMILLGTMGLMAAPGLYLLAGAMIVIATTAMVMALAFLIVATAIKMLGTEAIPAFAEGLLQGTLKLIMVSGLILAASGLLIAAVAIMVVVVLSIAVMAIALAVAGTLFLVGAALLTIGSSLVLASGIMIAVGGVAILVGGIALMIGLTAVMIAMPIMIAASVALVAGAVMLMVGAALLLPAAGMILASGAMIAVGGGLILIGSWALMQAGPMLVQAGPQLIAGAASLLAGAAILGAAGAAVLAASSGIFLGGVMIGVGGVMLLLGVSSMVLAGQLLAQSASAIQVGMATLVMMVPSIMAAAVMLLPAAITLGLAGQALLLGSVGVATAGLLLLTGASTLYLGVLLIEMSAQLMKYSAPSLMQSAATLALAGIMLLSALVAMTPAAVMMVVVGTLVAAGSIALVAAAVALGLAGPPLLVASGVMAAAAGVLTGAMGAIVVGSSMVLHAGQMLDGGSRLMVSGAQLLNTAAVMIMGSMGSLNGIGNLIAESSRGLMNGMAELSMAARIMLMSTVVLLVAGRMMQPAAWSIYSGLMWLDFSVNRFSKTLDKVTTVAMVLSTLASAFQMLQMTPLNGLRAMSDEALAASPNIERLGSELGVAAKKLDEGVKAFEGPAERLNAILMKLTETITAFGSGLNLSSDIGALASMLDNYANLLENASDRINTAVATKAVPAMRAAGEAGLEETVRSEAISTVQVITNNDGAARDSDEVSDHLSKISATMADVRTLLTDMQSGGRGELSEIVALLQSYLPNLNKSGGGLDSEFNSWAK